MTRTSSTISPTPSPGAAPNPDTDPAEVIRIVAVVEVATKVAV